MDISSIPAEYFDTKKYFKGKDKKLRQKGYVVDRYGRPIKKRHVKRRYSKFYTIGFIISALITIALVIVMMLLSLGVIDLGNQSACPPNFNYGICEKNDFLDTYIWKSTKNYDVASTKCSYGCSFRIWAPKAESVVVAVTDDINTNQYSMTRQNDGCWFSNICNVDYGNYYAFEISSNNGTKRCRKLSLGSSEIIHDSVSGDTNRIVGDISAIQEPKMDISVSPIYQIFIPAFVTNPEDSTYLYQLINQLSYFVEIGVKTIQLFPVEQYYCKGSSHNANCWKHVSISYPGVIHRKFGASSLFRELVSKAHELGIYVLLEVNWSLFDEKSVLYNIDCDGTWGSFFKQSSSSSVDSRHKLDINRLKQTGNYITKVIQRWRHSVGIDGIVWNDAGCLLYTGHACPEGRGSLDLEGLQFMQNLIKQTDFIHISDFHDVYASSLFTATYDKSLPLTIQSILTPSQVNCSQLASFITSLIQTQVSQRIFCFEDRITSETRFVSFDPVSDPDYHKPRRQAIGLTIEFLSPLIPCLFMGTEFFTDSSFSDNPQSIDWSFRNNRLNQHSMFLLLTERLIGIRQQFSIQNSEIEMYWYDDELNMISYLIRSKRTVLLAIINISDKTYSMADHQIILVPVPIIDGKSWSALFSSETSAFSTHFENESTVVLIEDCPSNLHEGKCIKTSFHYDSIRIFRAV